MRTPGRRPGAGESTPTRTKFTQLSLAPHLHTAYSCLIVVNICFLRKLTTSLHRAPSHVEPHPSAWDLLCAVRVPVHLRAKGHRDLPRRPHHHGAPRDEPKVVELPPRRSARRQSAGRFNAREWLASYRPANSNVPDTRSPSILQCTHMYIYIPDILGVLVYFNVRICSVCSTGCSYCQHTVKGKAIHMDKPCLIDRTHSATNTNTNVTK